MKFKIIILILLIIFQKSKSAEFEKDMLNEPEPNMKFLFAVEKGDIELLKHFLKQNIDVNYQNSEGLTALHIAAKKGYKDIIKILLKIPNINVNIKNNEKENPFSYAFVFLPVEIAELLLINGSESNGILDHKYYKNKYVATLMENWRSYGKFYNQYKKNLIYLRLLVFELLVQRKEKFKSDKFENKLDLAIQSFRLPIPEPLAKIIVQFVMKDQLLMSFNIWCSEYEKLHNNCIIS